MEVTVQHKKKSVIVLDWGRAPFGLEENIRGRVYIPSGFKVQTVAARRVWIAITRVHEGMTQYKFQLKDEPKICSDWKKSPSGAFRQANERAKNVHYKKGTNAALICGVSYPNLQREILLRFGSQILETSSAAQHPPVKLEKDSDHLDYAASAKRIKTEEPEMPTLPEPSEVSSVPIEHPSLVTSLPPETPVIEQSPASADCPPITMTSSSSPLTTPPILTNPLDLEPITNDIPGALAQAIVPPLDDSLKVLDNWLAPQANWPLPQQVKATGDLSFAPTQQESSELQELDLLLNGPLLSEF